MINRILVLYKQFKCVTNYGISVALFIIVNLTDIQILLTKNNDAWVTMHLGITGFQFNIRSYNCLKTRQGVRPDYENRSYLFALDFCCSY